VSIPKGGKPAWKIQQEEAERKRQEKLSREWAAKDAKIKSVTDALYGKTVCYFFVVYFFCVKLLVRLSSKVSPLKLSKESV